MKKFILSFLSVLVLGSLSLTSAFAVTLDSGENLSISKGILDDAYLAGGNVSVNEDVWGDLYVVGGTVTIDSNIHQDLVVLGGKVNIQGDVFGDLRVVGGQVSIYGNIGEDLIVLGGQIDIGKSSVITGSLVAASGILTVNGKVVEDIRGSMGGLILNGVVERDVIITVEDAISISESASIKGNLQYSSFVETVVPAGVVGGETTFTKFEKKTFDYVSYEYLSQKILGYLSALLLALVFVLFAPNGLVRASKMTKENLLKTLGVGLLTVVLALISAIILMVTVVGIEVGLILLFLFLVAMFVSKIFVAVWLAGYVMNLKKDVSKAKLFGVMALALLVYCSVGMIPFAGVFIKVVLFLIGVGTLYLFNLDQYRFLKSKGRV
jgi:hypothetical protein